MTKHVLVIDDSLLQTRVLAKVLEKHGYQVSVACNGQEGIEVAEATSPDIIVMDVVMPLLNGFQATRELGRSKATAHIPVIVCSAKSARTDKVWAERQGAKAYLVKPIKEQDLLDTVKQLLDGADDQ